MPALPIKNPEAHAKGVVDLEVVDLAALKGDKGPHLACLDRNHVRFHLVDAPAVRHPGNQLLGMLVKRRLQMPTDKIRPAEPRVYSLSKELAHIFDLPIFHPRRECLSCRL